MEIKRQSEGREGEERLIRIKNGLPVQTPKLSQICGRIEGRDSVYRECKVHQKGWHRSPNLAPISPRGTFLRDRYIQSWIHLLYHHDWALALQIDASHLGGR